LSDTAAAPLDAEVDQRPGHRVEADGENDEIRRIFLLARLQAVFGNTNDRFLVDVDEIDIVAIEGLEIVGIEAQPLGAERIALRRQLFGGDRILDDPAHLLCEEIRHHAVGVFAEGDVTEAALQVPAAKLPGLFHAFALFFLA
jgi:hypothetical protein